MRYFPFAICVVLFSLVANSCSDNITRSPEVTVLSVQGRVSSGANERADLGVVTAKTKIHQGDIVRSSGGAFLDLQLVPGALTRLLADSEVKMEELKIIKDGNDTSDGIRNRIARVRLNRGKVLLLFSPPSTGGLQLEIITNQATVKPDSECLFSVWTDGNTTRVTGARDKVTGYDTAHGHFAINAGFFQQWPATAPKTLQAAGNADAQIDTKEIIEAERQLLDEANASQNRKPF